MSNLQYHAIGRRKEAVSRVYLRPGSGAFVVNDRPFDQYFPKFLNYAEWGAAQAFRDGRKAGFTEVAGRPFWRFLRTYFLQLGFLDGRHGLVLCLLQSFGVFLKYARLWEYNIRSQRGDAIQLPAFDDSESTWKRPGES